MLLFYVLIWRVEWKTDVLFVQAMGIDERAAKNNSGKLIHNAELIVRV